MNDTEDSRRAALLAAAAQALRADRLEEVEGLCREVLAHQPAQPDAILYLARVLHERGDSPAALQAVERALAAAPDHAALHNSRGMLLHALQRPEEARAAFLEALRCQPDYLDACFNLVAVGCLDESESCFLRAMALHPGQWRGYGGYGDMLLRHQQYSRAVKWLREALRLQPGEARLWERLGLALRNLGQFTEAETAYRRALQLRPDFATAHSALLSMLGYHVLASPAQLLAEHQAWDRLHGGGARRLGTFAHRPRPGARRRLRIGYVSPDFDRHAVSYFIEPLLEYHDRSQVEVFCYAEVHNPDEVTARLQARADVWRSTVGRDDEAVARMIHADGIDVLVDLAGHSHAERSRIRVFTYKPAPVQATYLGYFSTTGLQAMDYWISDAVTHPAATPEEAVERIYRLPRCCVSYRPPEDAPPVAERAPGRDEITFGCFNDLTKIGDLAIECWSRILQALPTARLVLKAGQLADPSAREAILARFSAHGVAASRLTLLSHTPSQREHLGLYQDIDIALDTAPRTGVTTTADALWMGVPVITLAGERFIERLGASLLSSIGLES
ncbi:MAG: tetratricopeptide repeat protein, partial [Gammaproteobacteria bacterium]